MQTGKGRIWNIFRRRKHMLLWTYRINNNSVEEASSRQHSHVSCLYVVSGNLFNDAGDKIHFLPEYNPPCIIRERLMNGRTEKASNYSCFSTKCQLSNLFLFTLQVTSRMRTSWSVRSRARLPPPTSSYTRWDNWQLTANIDPTSWILLSARYCWHAGDE